MALVALRTGLDGFLALPPQAGAETRCTTGPTSRRKRPGLAHSGRRADGDDRGRGVHLPGRPYPAGVGGLTMNWPWRAIPPGDLITAVGLTLDIGSIILLFWVAPEKLPPPSPPPFLP